MRVAAHIEINASAGKAFAAATDVARLAEWVPEISAAQVLASEGDIQVVELTAPHVSTGRLVLECVRTADRHLVFSQVDRLRGRGLSGFIAAERLGDEGVSRIRIQVDNAASAFNILARRRVRDVLEHVLVTLARRVSSSEGPDDGGGVRRKILEVVRRDGKLFLWFEGVTIEIPEETPAGDS